MKTLKYLSWLLVVLNFATAAYFFAHRTPEKQFLIMPFDCGSLVFLLAMLGVGLYFCRRDKLRAFLPFIICLAGLPLGFFMGGHLGSYIKDQRFNRNFPRYLEVVRLIRSGKIGNPLPFELPPPYSDLARRAEVETNSNGAISIEFITELGFPVKHSGYLYTSDGEMKNDPRSLERWPYHSRINTNWFRISD